MDKKRFLELRKWLDKNNLSVDKWARLCDISTASGNAILYYGAKIGKENRAKIEKATPSCPALRCED